MRPDLAGRPVRIIYAFVLQDGGQPSLLIALEGLVWRFDASGRVDFGVPDFDSARIGLDTPFAADVLPAERTQTGDRWLPETWVRRAIERDIWPDGPPMLGPVECPQQAESCPNLSRALAAVGSAGVARMMSRLVSELSLTKQTVNKLMAALAVEPQTLLDLIAAEQQSETTHVH